MALDADPRTGQRRWTDRHFLFRKYNDAELGYAVTDHAAQGRTVHTGLEGDVADLALQALVPAGRWPLP